MLDINDCMVGSIIVSKGNAQYKITKIISKDSIHNIKCDIENIKKGNDKYTNYTLDLMDTGWSHIIVPEDLTPKHCYLCEVGLNLCNFMDKHAKRM